MCTLAHGTEDPLVKDHMSDEVFMKAAWHMKIEGVEESPDKIVVTTGATFAFAPATDTLTCRQRIGKERRVLTVWLGGQALAGLKVKAKDTGAVILTSEAGLTVKVNCDSLLMLRTAKPIGATFRHEFKEAVTYHAPDNRLWIDNLGAVGVYPITKATVLMQYSPEGETHDVYALQAGGEIWAAIGPPRPYPWKESMALRPIWQGSWESIEQNIPSDELIKGYKEIGTLLWMQSGGLLWKKREEAFEARLPERFQHALDTADKLGLPVIVWASPYYFTKGLSTAQSWTGENMGAYLEAIDSEPGRDLFRRGLSQERQEHVHFMSRHARISRRRPDPDDSLHAQRAGRQMGEVVLQPGGRHVGDLHPARGIIRLREFRMAALLRERIQHQQHHRLRVQQPGILGPHEEAGRDDPSGELPPGPYAHGH